MEVRQLDVPDTDVIQVGQGPDLLLLHTLLAERTVFDRALPELAAKYRVTIPNLPGYGGTPPLENPSPQVRDYADRIVGIMDAVGLPNDTSVLGNGAGGFMSVSLAVNHGDRFGKLILADTGPGFPEAAKAPLRFLADKVEADGMEAVLDAAMFECSQRATSPKIPASFQNARLLWQPVTPRLLLRRRVRLPMLKWQMKLAGSQTKLWS